MDRDEVIERLCKLQGEVQEAIGFSHEADCFCGKSGAWGSGSYGPTHAEGYRNDGAALEFIEAAVRTAIAVRSAGGRVLRIENDGTVSAGPRRERGIRRR